MRRSLLCSGLLALCLVATGGATQAAVLPGGDVLPDQDVVLSGTIDGAEIDSSSLLVGVKQGNWRTLPEGSSFEIYQVPPEQVRVVGDSWSVSLDPLAVPAEFVAPDGQVDFIIEAHADSGAAAFHTVSARRITELGTEVTGWLRAGAVLPDGWTALPGLAAPASAPASAVDASAPQLGTGPGTDEMESTDTSTASLDVGELGGIPLEVLETPTGMPADDGQGTDTSFLLARPPATDVSMRSSAPWNCNEVSGYRRELQTTIATGYPVGGDGSSLTYSSTMKTTSGTATNFGGAWSESGSETTTDGWGATFTQDTRKRSYRTVVTYGYFICHNAAGYSSGWVFPIKQPGAAYYYYLSSAPNWTRCQPAYSGVIWRRSSSTGNDYELSYGVKAKDYVGFEMYSRHGYSSGSQLRYHVMNGHKRVCGNNNSPGQAGKVQEKY